MAKIIRGQNRGTEVLIGDVRGEFAIIGNKNRLRLGMLEVTGLEAEILEAKYADTDTFKIHYDIDHFRACGRFKKHHWASARS